MKTKILAVGACIVSAAVGAVGGYFLARRKLEAEYAEIARTEIEEARVFYKKDEDSTPEGALAKRRPGSNLSDMDRQVAEEGREDGPATGVLNRVLTGLKYGAPTVGGPKQPYVIAQDIFMNGEVGYPNITLTYFAGDEILVDEADEPIEDVEMTVGSINLTYFGRDSGDERVVYVRNDRLQIDYEVCLDDGKYSATVGLEE